MQMQIIPLLVGCVTVNSIEGRHSSAVPWQLSWQQAYSNQ